MNRLCCRPPGTAGPCRGAGPARRPAPSAPAQEGGGGCSRAGRRTRGRAGRPRGRRESGRKVAEKEKTEILVGARQSVELVGRVGEPGGPTFRRRRMRLTPSHRARRRGRPRPRAAPGPDQPPRPERAAALAAGGIDRAGTRAMKSAPAGRQARPGRVPPASAAAAPRKPGGSRRRASPSARRAAPGSRPGSPTSRAPATVPAIRSPRAC